ncbi:serine/threonine-protein kinase [Marinactinospora rubrisoli]|uniref:Serine/threonine-protein kinase n=1 Tax=Marinactinospora rubrisoli TaxID=2715399 RepID=A0ABW2KF67_9ACTN
MAMTAGFPEGEGLPERIGPYQIRRKIGQGGMGVVYQAVDPQDRLVAIKVLRSEVAGDDIARARLAREVETMRRVNSRNVAGVIDADTNAPLPWVVTEYIPGPTLDSTVTNHGPLRGRALTRFVSGLAQAINDIHATDVIHRDLKPGNVIISNGEPIVIDFGIAHAVDGAKLTQTGTFVGTPSYLSPEVIEGTDLGPATDIHAWGATVAFAATGNPPYGAGAFEVIFFRILNGEINLDGMPEALKPLVLAAVSRDLRDRPTAQQLLAETSRLNLDLPWTEEGYQASGLTGHHTVQAPRPDRGDDDGFGAAGAAAAGGLAGAAAGAAAGGLAGGWGDEHGGHSDATQVREPSVAVNAELDANATRVQDPQATRAQRPDQTMVAGSGGADWDEGSDRTMVAGGAVADDPQRTGLLPADDPDDDPHAPRTHFFNSTLRPEEFRDILTPVDYDRGRTAPDRTATFQADEFADEDEEEPRRGLFGRRRSEYGRSDRLSDYFPEDEEQEEAEPRRLPSLILIPLLLALAGLTLMVPTIGLIVGLLGASVLAALDTVKVEHARRLQTRGPRSSDSMVVALSMPWALLRALGRAALYGLGYLLGGIVVGLIVGFTFGESDANHVGAYALAITVLLTFLGPNGGGARRQAVWLTENVGIRNPYVYWGLIVAVCLLALFLLVFGFQVLPAWNPIPGPSQWFG